MKIIFAPLVSVCLYLAVALPLLGSNPSDETSQDTLRTRSQHALYVGTGYGSDLLYTVSSLSGNQAYLSADLMYAWKGKLWASVAAYHLPGFIISIPFYDLSAGYRHTFNKYFDMAATLSSYQSSNKLEEEFYGSFEYLRFSAGIDWQWVYSRFTVGTILGENHGIYLYLKNSRYFTTPDLGNAGSYFAFDPGINMLFGNYSNVVPQQQTPFIPVRPGHGPGPGNQGPAETETTQNVFSLMNIEFSIPVTFNFHEFAVDIEPMYLLPVNSNENTLSSKGFFFFLGLSYRIF